MPRRKVNTEVPGPFHVGARCINKEWFNLPMPQVWDLFSEQLFLVQKAFHLEIHSFVLMSNHYHMLLSTPQLNLTAALMYFQREVSRQLNREGNRINRTFADRFFRTHITTDLYFSSCYKYVYQNPLRAQLVNYAEAYPFSTLHGKLGLSRLVIPVTYDSLLFDGDFQENLSWLNASAHPEDIHAVRAALRRGVFKLKLHPYSKGSHRLEHQRL